MINAVIWRANSIMSLRKHFVTHAVCIYYTVGFTLQKHELWSEQINSFLCYSTKIFIFSSWISYVLRKTQNVRNHSLDLFYIHSFDLFSRSLRLSLFLFFRYEFIALCEPTLEIFTRPTSLVRSRYWLVAFMFCFEITNCTSIQHLITHPLATEIFWQMAY